MKRRYFKIGIAGTHSTGKSTFLDSLKIKIEQQGLRVGVIKDLARAARNEGFPILKEQTEDTALWIMAEGIRREVAATLCSDVILVDRAIFDALGYLEAALEITHRERDDARHAMLEGMCRSYCQDYDLIIVTVLDQSMPLGEGRDPDENFRALAGDKIRAIADKLGRPFIIMTSKDRESVQDEVVSLVRSRLGGIVSP